MNLEHFRGSRISLDLGSTEPVLAFPSCFKGSRGIPGFGKSRSSPSGKKSGIKAQENRSGNKEKKILLNVGGKNLNPAFQGGEKPGREDGNGQGRDGAEGISEFLAELEGADAQPQHVLPDLRHLQGQKMHLGVEIQD